MKTLLPEEHIMKFDLDEEQSDIRNMVRRFTEREITPYAGAWDETQRFPREIYHKLAELGLMGMTTPEEYGGGAPRRPSAARGFVGKTQSGKATPPGLFVNNKTDRARGPFCSPAH